MGRTDGDVRGSCTDSDVRGSCTRSDVRCTNVRRDLRCSSTSCHLHVTSTSCYVRGANISCYVHGTSTSCYVRSARAVCRTSFHGLCGHLHRRFGTGGWSRASWCPSDNLWIEGEALGHHGSSSAVARPCTLAKVSLSGESVARPFEQRRHIRSPC